MYLKIKGIEIASFVADGAAFAKNAVQTHQGFPKRLHFGVFPDILFSCFLGMRW